MWASEVLNSAARASEDGLDERSGVVGVREVDAVEDVVAVTGHRNDWIGPGLRVQVSRYFVGDGTCLGEFLIGAADARGAVRDRYR